jgi:hypothetical protein
METDFFELAIMTFIICSVYFFSIWFFLMPNIKIHKKPTDPPPHRKKRNEWKSTNKLRWYSEFEHTPPILQQQWKSNDGRIIWRGIDYINKN